MKMYKNSVGDSGIIAYENGPDFIRIQFMNGGVYLYTNDSTGAHNVKQMKVLAESGHGLCTFINQNVRGAYARKER